MIFTRSKRVLTQAAMFVQMSATYAVSELGTAAETNVDHEQGPGCVTYYQGSGMVSTLGTREESASELSTSTRRARLAYRCTVPYVGTYILSRYGLYEKAGIVEYMCADRLCLSKLTREG